MEGVRVVPASSGRHSPLPGPGVQPHVPPGLALSTEYRVQGTDSTEYRIQGSEYRVQPHVPTGLALSTEFRQYRIQGSEYRIQSKATCSTGAILQTA